jgi:uncharacterized caspase-like protein
MVKRTQTILGTVCLLSLGLLPLVVAQSVFADDGQRGIKVVKEAPESVVRALYDKSFAVVVGINQYPKGGRRLSNLSYAVSDAQGMAKKLQELGFEVKMLIDEQATRDRIVETLADDIGKRAGLNDRIIFYFAGHGDTKEKANHAFMGYILPYDYNPERHATTAISMQQIRDISAEIQAKHVLYAMDSCFSGGILTGRAPAPNAGMAGFEYLRNLTQTRAHVVITAGAKDQTVKEEGGSGIFTRILIQALTEKANMPWSQDGYVTAIDLASYIKRKIPALAPDQTPQYGHLDGEGDVVLNVFKPIDIPVPATPDNTGKRSSKFVPPSF